MIKVTTSFTASMVKIRRRNLAK